jgi:hypothetical protein
MKHFRTVMRNVEEHDTPTCDICGKKIDWEHRGDSYKLEEAKISYKSGSDVSGVRSYKHFNPDICSFCMREAIIPMITPILNRDVWEEKWEEYR